MNRYVVDLADMVKKSCGWLCMEAIVKKLLHLSFLQSPEIMPDRLMLMTAPSISWTQANAPAGCAA